MSTSIESTPRVGLGARDPIPGPTAADLVALFGPIPLSRLHFNHFPSLATEQDVLDVQQREKRLCELVDGILVEKALRYQKSYLALLLGRVLGNFVAAKDLGIILGADGLTRLAAGLVRIPDISFIPWERHPDRKVPSLAFVPFAPALAVEVLSPSNTPQEMSRKLTDYFSTGVRLVWFVDPRARTVEVFTGPGQSVVLNEGDTLDGGEVLPGFAVTLAELFSGLGTKAE